MHTTDLDISKLSVAERIQRADISQSELARRMKTSRSAVERLLDPTNPSVTLSTLERAASAIGKRLSVRLTAWPRRFQQAHQPDAGKRRDTLRLQRAQVICRAFDETREGWAETMRACRVALKRVRLGASIALVSTALLLASGCTSSGPPAESPSPLPSPPASAASTPEQFVSSYLVERARAVLPGEPLSGLRRFLLAGVPWLQREKLLATGKLLSEKALGHTLTSVDCQVSVARVTLDKTDDPTWVRVAADVTTTLHWTDADARAGSDTTRLPHTVTIVVGNTETGRWRVVSDEYADPEAPRLLTLARAEREMIRASQSGLRAETAALRPIARAAMRYWTSQRRRTAFMGQIAVDGRYLRLLAPGSPDRAVQEFAVRGARHLRREFSLDAGVNILSLAIDDITANADRTKATVSATCWFCGGDTKGQTWAQVTDVSQRTLALRKLGGRWLVWLDEYPPIEDLMWSPIPVPQLREQLQRALRLRSHGPLGGLRPAPPDAVAAMEAYFASADPKTFSGATRAAFVCAFTVPREPDGHQSTSTRLYLIAYYGAWGPVVAAGDMHAGYNGDFFLLTRPSESNDWQVKGIYYP